MAAAPDPDEVLTSTREKENFQRLARLLISGGTSLMREIFDKLCLPSNLPTILKNPAVEKKLKAAKLTKPQWDCLYPSTGVYGKSADFDVTLLFRLLRTICSITPPVTGWDALPTSTDHSLAAEIVRIKYYRNSVYGHVSQSMEITDDKFPKLWKDIREALLGIAGQISPAKKTAWQDAIDNFLKDPLTAEDERNVQELLRWYRKDIEVKECIETSAHKMREGMESLDISVREEAQDIKDQLGGELKTTSQEVQSLVREEARDIKDQLGRELKTTSQEIKDQLGEELKTTSEDVQSLVREEAQGIKDQLGEIQQSIDRLSSSADCREAAQIRLRIDCEAISGPGPRTGSSENKNVADGLAWSYYFGYLKLVLPKLEEQIGKSDEFRYKITTKKLFILLPKTCFTYDDIEHADDRVKWAGNLPECKINRGGIKVRSYKHAVHRIEMPRPDGGVDKYHFVLEYAIPLMVLYDMSTHADAPLSRQERDHQMVLFMRKLTEILDNSPECRGKYQLVLISGTETNKIADVLVTTYNNPNIEVADAN